MVLLPGMKWKSFIELMFDMMKQNSHSGLFIIRLMLQPPVLDLVRPKLEKILQTIYEHADQIF